MLIVSDTALFRKDVKRIKKRGMNASKLDKIIAALALEQELPPNARPHKLAGEYTGM